MPAIAHWECLSQAWPAPTVCALDWNEHIVSQFENQYHQQT